METAAADNDDWEYPQPSAAPPYRYARYETANEQLAPPHGGNHDGVLAPETLVWVLLSKGKHRVPKLFCRARVVDGATDADGRVTVRYPSGSTYRVRPARLVPAREDLDGCVLVAAETVDYRRMSIVHTLATDAFAEIGCDSGILVHAVDAKSKLGIDKSEASIEMARERYPDHAFVVSDVFEDDWKELPLAEPPTVVSIDINGNRELPAVLECLRLVLERWAPRLVLVKSRALHAAMVRRDHDDDEPRATPSSPEGGEEPR